MKLFYGDIENGIINIHEDEQQHILKVLRMKDGDKLCVTNGNGLLATGTLSVEGKKVLLKNAKIEEKQPPYSNGIHIAIAPTKNIDRIEFFVEKATEMGISEISFILTDKSERKNINIEKIRKQAISASKQSLRFHFPKVNDLMKLSDFIRDNSSKQIFVAHCDETFERQSLDDIKLENQSIFLIGPEGDFSPKEIEFLSEKGIKAISLGHQRLRTETAGIFVSAWGYAKNF